MASFSNDETVLGDMLLLLLGYPGAEERLVGVIEDVLVCYVERQRWLQPFKPYLPHDLPAYKRLLAAIVIQALLSERIRTIFEREIRHSRNKKVIPANRTSFCHSFGTIGLACVQDRAHGNDNSFSSLEVNIEEMIIRPVSQNLSPFYGLAVEMRKGAIAVTSGQQISEDEDCRNELQDGSKGRKKRASFRFPRNTTRPKTLSELRKKRIEHGDSSACANKFDVLRRDDSDDDSDSQTNSVNWGAWIETPFLVPLLQV